MQKDYLVFGLKALPYFGSQDIGQSKKKEN